MPLMAVSSGSTTGRWCRSYGTPPPPLATNRTPTPPPPTLTPSWTGLRQSVLLLRHLEKKNGDSGVWQQLDNCLQLPVWFHPTHHQHQHPRTTQHQHQHQDHSTTHTTLEDVDKILINRWHNVLSTVLFNNQ